MPTSFTLRCLLILGIAAISVDAQATIPDTQAIPKKWADKKVVSLVEDSRSIEGDYTKIKIRLINPTKSAISFTGYSESSPWYQMQRLVDNKWEEKKMGWFCGTGLRLCVIAPGESSVITTNVATANLPFKLGVTYNLGKKASKPNTALTVWSPAIEAASTKRVKE